MTLIPTREAMVLFWATARMALPQRVFLRMRLRPTIMAMVMP